MEQKGPSSKHTALAPGNKKKGFYQKKKDKGRERKKEGKAGRNNWKLFFSCIAFENLKRNSFINVALGAVPDEYITYPFVPGK